MADAGYLGTPLWKKLGIKPESKVVLVRAPLEVVEHVRQVVQPEWVRELPATGAYDVIVQFLLESTEMEREVPHARELMKPACGLWVAWPKRSSRVYTDLTEDVLRDFALKIGLVDNKVCAIDETWSGLRLVIPLIAR